MKGRLALTVDGKITICTASEENIGKGRCNHIAHQKPDQTPDEFVASIENLVSVEGDNTIPDQHESILNLVSQYGRIDNPNWKEVISSVENPFHIGKESDGSYEEATMVNFTQEEVDYPSGPVYHLMATYKFRDQLYECDYGEVPKVNEDGTITMDGVNWRVLPVVEQNKAAVISYPDNVVFKNKNGRDISMIMSKDPTVDKVQIYGTYLPIETVEDYLKTGNTSNLTTAQQYALADIDPVAYERFPQLKDGDLRSMKNLPADEFGDLTWRRCVRYQDIVKEQYRLQMRRMGVTFRTNLAKRQKAIDNGKYDPNNIDDINEMNKKFPLFYQYNLAENIKGELVGRSNVQFADNLNPIAALSQSQKISYTGPDGHNKDKAPYNLRMPHMSHKDLIDPMDISSGKNVGLTGTLSMGYIGEDRFLHRKDPSKCLSPSDFIPFKENNDPSRAIMAIAHMKQACPIVGGEDPLVSTPAWDKIKGSKLGTNLRIAYIPCDGVFEDAVVISQSAADKMATIQSQTYKTKYTKDLKVGQRVEMKDKVGDVEVKVGGTITKITDEGFDVETYYKMTPGNKLAGRHGNKSVVSKVLPDDEMPKVEDENGNWVPAQVIMSPLSVVGRKNLGQIYETNVTSGKGKVLNAKSNVILHDGTKIEATSGKQYILRLNHIAEKKISSHADELEAKREASGARLGEMESILLSTDTDRLRILDYLRHQEAYDSHNKLNSLLKAIGVDMSGVNWERNNFKENKENK